MSLEDRAKATAKNLEGKAQEAWGNVTSRIVAMSFCEPRS